MKEHKRWGKKFVDNRDWIEYNKRLVTRGEFLLDCEWVESWNSELKAMNEGKVGARYEYPNSFMCFLAVLQGIYIPKFWGDGSFDTYNLFAFLQHNNIEPAIKTRKNAVPKGDDSLRDREILKMKKGYKKWARKRQYGLRWNGTEGIFSAVKRKFGEQTRSHKIENIFNEVKRKFWVYDRMKTYAEMHS